jgi:hypothetical protein
MSELEQPKLSIAQAREHIIATAINIASSALLLDNGVDEARRYGWNDAKRYDQNRRETICELADLLRALIKNCEPLQEPAA